MSTSVAPNDTRAEESIEYLQCFGSLAAISMSAPTRSHYYRDCLEALGRTLKAYYGMIHVRISTETVEHHFDGGAADPEYFEEVSWQFLTDSLSHDCPRARCYTARHGEAELAVISAPIFNSNSGVHGAVVLILSGDRSQVEGHLQSLGNLAQFMSESVEMVNPAESEEDTAASTASDVLRQASSYSSWRELAYTITNRLKGRTGSDQVALGRVHRNRIQLVSISGLDDINFRAPGVEKISQAMEECLDHEDIILVQTQGDWSADEEHTDHKIHRQWHDATGASSVASIPIEQDGEVSFVLSMRRPCEAPYSLTELNELQTLVEPYSGALQLVERATRSVVRHSIETVAAKTRTLLMPGAWGTKAVLLALLCTTLWVCLGTWSYQVSVPCTIKPRLQRGFAAPESARLTEARVLPGDPIRKGELLCAFDTREIELEIQRLTAERDSADIEAGRALQNDDRAGLQMGLAQLRRLDAMIALARDRMAARRITAPFDGWVVDGDLRERIGDVMSKGEPILTVASNEGWAVELAIPENDIAEFDSVRFASFSPHARPEESYPIHVTRILPSPQVNNDHNRYPAEAEVDDLPRWVRPGMKGMARIQLGERKIWWVLSHRFTDYLRLNYWF